jgi:glucosamine--fructose-6-phosphate aminotransferase (isomerizing)
MCGIIGYLGSDSFVTYVLNGLKLIQNRGYDSVGIGTIMNGTLHTIKYASTNTYNSLTSVEKDVNNTKTSFNSNIGIGHTRWATHGSKTDINAHPHHDNLNRISLVHNGIIENFMELKNELLALNYSFKSTTDTEVIAVLIGYFLDSGNTIQEAIKFTIKKLRGTWALAIIDISNPNKMWITRNGSPLLLGIEDNFIMIASEQIGFSNYVNKYIILNNHDLIEISLHGSVITYNTDINSYPLQIKPEQDIITSPSPYNYWMEKEIMEQTIAVDRALNNGGRIASDTFVKLGGLDINKISLMKLNNIILLGCGTSYHAGLWSIKIFKSLDIFDTVQIYDGAEFTYNDISKHGKTGLILLSQSGETKDLHRCLQIAKDYDLLTIGVVNVVDSMIARETNCGVYLNAGREVSVGATKSFTSQCVVLSLIAIWFSHEKGTCLEKRRKIIMDVRNLSLQINNVLKQWSKAKHIALSLDNSCQNTFILGKGSSEAIAKESALKLKEIGYIHAEGFSSSALKHGSFALIIPKLPIFILDIDYEHHSKNMNAYQEIKARGAHIIKIGYDESCELVIDQNNTFGGIIANIYLQIISFEIALKNGYNPDYPRNLAKVVTVE